MNKELPEKSKARFLIYEAEDGRTKIEVRIEKGTVWLTQKWMAQLFQTSKQNISLHVKNIYRKKIFLPEGSVRKILTVKIEGGRNVERMLVYYNLDMIFSVGRRIKSHLAAHFRQWAIEELRENVVNEQNEITQD